MSVSTPLEPSPRAPWLGVTGALMLLTAFALYNAWFGFALIPDRLWPWQVLTDAGTSLQYKTALVAWLAAGLWCVVFAWLPTRRTRALGCGILAIVLLASGLAQEGTLREQHVVLHLLPPTLAFFAPAVFAAGLLLTREPQRRGRGRVLAGVGGLVCLWFFALPQAGADPVIVTTYHKLSAVFGGNAPTVQSLLESWVPAALTAVAALGALLAGLGLAGRKLVLVWFFVVLGAWVMQACATGAYYEGPASGIEAIGDAVVAGILVSHLLLVLLVTFIVRDLGCLRGGDA